MTKYLLDNRLAPLTFSVGFIEKPLPEVADFVRRWLTGHFADPEIRRTFPPLRTEPVNAALEDALRKLEPLVEPRAHLLLSTESGWTAFFSNGRHGHSGAGFGESWTCEKLSCRGIAVSCVPHTLVNEKKHTKGVYGAVTFVLLGAEKKEFMTYERTIVAANDGGRWVFRSNGAPLPFEQVSRYSARRVADRFTPEMLEEYCAAFGIRLFDPAFYGPNGTLFKLFHPRPKLRPMSLEEVQREMGPLPS